MPLLRLPLHTLDRRVADLVARFDDIARTRMVGVPLLNPALQVEAVGFTLEVEGEGEVGGAGVAVGILVTPWFMNLVRLPLQPDACTAGVGRVQRHQVGTRSFEFIGAHEGMIGAYAACSLFSPVLEFDTRAAARETALAVLDALRPANPALAPARPAEPVPARRSFLLGRSAAHEATR